MALQRWMKIARVAGRRLGSVRGLCSTQVKWGLQRNATHSKLDLYFIRVGIQSFFISDVYFMRDSYDFCPFVSVKQY